MTTDQQNNFDLIQKSLASHGITNENMQAAILATVSKESNFVPQSENLNYSFNNIKRVWTNTDDTTAQQLANNPQALGDYKYGGKYGNASNEGYKYRGRGFNQITFKGNYKNVGDKIGVDLVSNPDLLNDPKVAADALAVFYRDELKAGDNAGSFKKFGISDSTMVADTATATKIAVQINAGRGTDFNNGVVQEGYKKASSVVDVFLNTIKAGGAIVSGGISEIKNNPIATILMVIGVAGIMVAIIRG